MSVTLTSSGITFSDATTVTTIEQSKTDGGGGIWAPVGTVVFGYTAFKDPSNPTVLSPASTFATFGQTFSGASIWVPRNLTPASTSGSTAYQRWYSLGDSVSDHYVFDSFYDSTPLGFATSQGATIVERYADTSVYPTNPPPLVYADGTDAVQTGTWKCLSPIARTYIVNTVTYPDITRFVWSMWVRIA